MAKKTQGFRTWIEIDRKAIKKNYGTFRSLVSQKTKLLAVVKSNAYGHSLIDFAREMEKNGADWLGVDSIVEALALRREGIAVPILVLGFTLPNRFGEAAEKNISLSVSNFETLAAISKSNFSRPLKIHIKVDTGMHRQGFLFQDIKNVLKNLQLPVSDAKLKIEGLFTHFAAAKNPAFPQYTNLQIAEFEKWRAAFKKAGFNPICHASATAGAMIFPNSRFDMVRIGIGLYGLWPAKEIEAFFVGRVKLTPVLSWKTIISEIKELPEGAKIGYDCTETLSKKSRVAVCPVGYWHGFPRALSSIGSVIVGGKRCRVLGRVSMDMITIDVSGVPKAKIEDEVILIGRLGREEISAEYLASLCDGSYYEFLTRLNPLIKRIYE